MDQERRMKILDVPLSQGDLSGDCILVQYIYIYIHIYMCVHLMLLLAYDLTWLPCQSRSAATQATELYTYINSAVFHKPPSRIYLKRITPLWLNKLESEWNTETRKNVKLKVPDGFANILTKTKNFGELWTGHSMLHNV